MTVCHQVILDPGPDQETEAIKNCAKGNSTARGTVMYQSIPKPPILPRAYPGHLT